VTEDGRRQKNSERLQEAVKDGDGYVLKTVATIVEDSQDRFHDECPMK
jgi:branched-chain amino acid transport system substrate-binding protein